MSNRSAMSKRLDLKPKEYVILGPVLWIVGYVISQLENSILTKIVSETIITMGWVSLIGGIVLLVRGNKAK